MQYLTTGGEYLKKHPGFKLVGRDNDLNRLLAILMRSKAASVLLVGPGGVGSTALCMGLQAIKEDPNVPFDIISKRIHWLATDRLFATGDSEQINAAFNKIVAILKRTPDSILIIEDARDFIEGARNNNCSHLINSLNALVKNNETQVIIEVRDDDLEMVLKSHSDMRQRYTLIDLNEPVGDDLIAIAKASAKSLEKHHNIVIDDEAINTAIELGTKYRARDASLSRAQPERSINLLDRALSSYRLEAHKLTSEEDQTRVKELYATIRDAEIAVINLEEKIEQEKAAEQERVASGQQPDVETKSINAFQLMSSSAGFESKEIRALREQITQYNQAIVEYKKEFDELTSRLNASLKLTQELVLEEFSRLSGIPANKLNEDEKAKLLHLADDIKTQVFGQDHVVEALTNAVKIARIGRRNGNKPQAAFMLLGPSGTGKCLAYEEKIRVKIPKDLYDLINSI